MFPNLVASPAELCILAAVLEDYCQKHDIPPSDPRRALASRRIEDLFRTGMHRAEDLELILRDIRLS